jgi:ribosomal protein L40E
MDNLPNTLQSVTFIRISDTDRVDQDLYEILVKRHLNSSFFDVLCKSKRDQSYFFSSLRELTLDEVGYSIDFFKLIRPIECPKLKKISIDLDFATPSNQGDQIAASDVLKELGNLNLSELCVNFPRNFSENVSRTFLRFENLLVLKVCMDRVNWASNLSVMFDNLANLNTFEIHFPIDRVRRQVDTPQLKSFIDLKLSSKILKSLQLIDWNQHRIFTDPGEKLHSSSLLDTLEVSNHLLLKFPNLIEFEICMDCNMTNPVQNSRCLLYSKCIYYQQSNSNNNNKRSNAHTN